MKKIISLMLTIALFFASIAIPGIQADAAEVNFIPFQANGAWVSGKIEKNNTSHYYSVTVPQTGWLSVTFQGFSVKKATAYIKDKDLSAGAYETLSVTGASDTNPVTKSGIAALEPGTYAIKVTGSYVGEYRLKAEFEPVSTNESPNNHSFSTAQALSFDNQINGFVSQNENTDFYQFTLPASQTVSVIYTSYIKKSDFTIYNKDFIKVASKTVNNASEDNPLAYAFEGTLDPGVYYVRIKGAYCGRYSLTMLNRVAAQSVSISGSSQMAVGQTVQLYASVTPGDVTDSRVKWTSGNSGIASVDRNTGLVTAYRPGIVTIRATAQDGSNVFGTYKITVKPKKMGAPKLKNLSKGRVRVSYLAQKGVRAYQIQYGTKKNFKGASSKKYVGKSMVISKLKSKKTYYFRVRSYYSQGTKTLYGDWSQVKKIKVK